MHESLGEACQSGHLNELLSSSDELLAHIFRVKVWKLDPSPDQQLRFFLWKKLEDQQERVSTLQLAGAGELLSQFLVQLSDKFSLLHVLCLSRGTANWLGVARHSECLHHVITDIFAYTLFITRTTKLSG